MTGDASTALRASSERRKRKAADMAPALSPQLAAAATDAISDLPHSAYAGSALSPASAVTYYRDTTPHALPTYNPNHHSLQSRLASTTNGRSGDDGDEAGIGGGEDDDGAGIGMDGEYSAGELDLTAKRKRQHTADVDMADSAVPLPASAVLVCPLQQMCVEHLAQPAVVNQLSALPPLPQPLLLAILQRASVESLRRVQAANGWIKEADLDELWKAAAVRRWGKQEVAREESAASSARRQQQTAATAEHD